MLIPILRETFDFIHFTAVIIIVIQAHTHTHSCHERRNPKALFGIQNLQSL